MIAARTFAGARVALFGLGGSGLATAMALREGGAEVIAWDDNPESVARADETGIATADLRTLDWTDVNALLLAPGVPLTHPKPHWSVDLARANDVGIIGDIEVFSRELAAASLPSPLVAITGTNGKSTTTALLSHMLASSGRDVQMGGNIGRAALTLDPPADQRHYVLECSSYQIDLAPSLSPTVGMLLNLSPDHLDRHGTMDHYASIKARLVARSDVAVIGVDDNYCARIADELEDAGHKVVRVSVRQRLDDGYFADGETLLRATNGQAQDVASLAGIGSLRGRHNAQNALAALAACETLGLSPDEIQQGLRSFPGLAHRMEQVARRGHVLFINDSKATNADAAAPALSSFEHIYWIAGGLAKEGGIEPLRPYFPRIARAYLIGEAAPAFAATLGDEVDFEISARLDAAVAHAAAHAGADNAREAVVLLSPACASFDQFRNFEVRGEAFRAEVMALDAVEPIGG